MNKIFLLFLLLLLLSWLQTVFIPAGWGALDIKELIVYVNHRTVTVVLIIYVCHFYQIWLHICSKWIYLLII